MTANELSNLIRSQIGNRWDATNAHGVDLRKCLVPPFRVEMVTVCSPSPGEVASEENVTVWVVLEENPETKAGYQIVFEESMGEFGLACTDTKGRPFYLGRYGYFMTTLNAM